MYGNCVRYAHSAMQPLLYKKQTTSGWTSSFRGLGNATPYK